MMLAIASRRWVRTRPQRRRSTVMCVRVMAVARLGHGESDKPHDLAEHLEHLIVSDIVAVLDAERVDRALVWGFSMGARNAASQAVMEPTRVGPRVVCVAEVGDQADRVGTGDRDLSRPGPR